MSIFRLSRSNDVSNHHQGDPQVTFVYNTVYRPEFITAALISSVISGCGLSHLPKAAKPLCENSHTPAALSIYLVLVVLMIWLTRRYRRRFAPIRTVIDIQRGPLLHTIDETIPLRDVVRLQESFSRFFGRRIRQLDIVDASHRRARVDEMLYAYDRFKHMLRELCPVSSVETDEPLPALQACRERWDSRQSNFLASEDPIRFHSNTPFFVCLILLLIVDGLFNVFAQCWLVAAAQPDLIVYLTPASVIVSALATRFGYYYLFTAVSLNPQSKSKKWPTAE